MEIKNLHMSLNINMILIHNQLFLEIFTYTYKNKTNVPRIDDNINMKLA